MQPHPDPEARPYTGYDAARSAAAVLDRSSRGKLAVKGSDRRSFLHAMLTNDIQSLSPGTGCYSAYLTPQGRMISDMRVLELGDLVLVDLDSSVAADVLRRLDQLVFSEDVQLGDVTEPFALMSVVGPSAASVVSSVLGAEAVQATATRIGADELAGWQEFRNQRANFAGDVAIVVASHEVGGPGFDLFVPAGQGGRLFAALQAAGAAVLSPEEGEVLRVEAGRPAFGRDMDRDTIPLEAAIESRAVSFTKGCYPGQEVVIRILHRGHGRIARRLCGLLLEGEQVPSAGDLLRAGERDAGRVTSSAWSPQAGRPIAIAMVYRDFLAPGTRLDVVHGNERLSARVTGLGEWE